MPPVNTDTPGIFAQLFSSGWVGASVALIYIVVLLLVAFYGFHRYVLLYLYVRHRSQPHTPRSRWPELPPITVQLPMYEEDAVAERVIRAAAALDYPPDKLQIQVLDDSTGPCAHIAKSVCDELAARGVDIQYIHRSDRTGYKAGALENAMKSAKADLIAIFDADFIPPPDVLHNIVHHFTDPAVGMVQVRWDHLNRDDSILTRSQAIFLDGHFLIEHTARNRSGRFMHFNGTAGAWRRKAIEEAGGWQHDTLTEDLDLSYRAQLKGWKFIYLPDIFVPAELPQNMLAFRSQAHRWAKGSAQTGIKLLPRILSSHLPRRVKMEAFYHLTNTAVYPLMVLLSLLIYPAFYNFYAPFKKFSAIGHFGFTLSLFVLATCSASTFFIYAQRELFGKSGAWRCLAYLPALMAIGVGISLNNAKAVFEAVIDTLRGRGGEFVRTPKSGTTGKSATPLSPSLMISTPPPRPARKSIRWSRLVMPILEILMGCYMVFCIGIALIWQFGYATIPFLLIFAAGYFYVGLGSLFGLLRAARPLVLPKLTVSAAPSPSA